MRDIADTSKISEGSVYTYTILNDHLSMRKLDTALLTVDQKQRRLDNSERCLASLCGSTTTHENHNVKELSGQKLVKAIRSYQKCKGSAGKVWAQCFRMCTVFDWSTILRMEKNNQQ